MKKFACSYLVVVLVLLALSPQLSAQDNAAPKPAPNAQQQQPPQADPQDQSADAKAFTGTIVKDGGKLVLKDMTNATYQLDDQQQAKNYQGKTVKITGSLDASSNTIHVAKIELAS